MKQKKTMNTMKAMIAMKTMMIGKMITMTMRTDGTSGMKMAMDSIFMKLIKTTNLTRSHETTTMLPM